MNKAGLIEEVANKVGTTKKETGNIIDAIVEIITNTLSKEEKITLVGFGTFQVFQRKARKGRNPQTGEELQISAKKVPKFRPGKKLREKVIK
ncbi:MAG: HU family DNA-binding protein [Candidatus Aerophobetes bacterium]|nr:HU family DNA-binding protein [Candidatus Aerophobetes bacterium]